MTISTATAIETKSEDALEHKDGDGDTSTAVEQAVVELQTAFESKITALTADVKAATDAATAAKTRADALEIKLARPGHANDNVAPLDIERKAVAHFARTEDQSKLIELKTMSGGSDPDGGYFNLTAMSAGMTKKLHDQSAMRRVSRVETITAGDSWSEPIDNGESGADWVGERSSRPATDTPDLGMLNVPLREIYANQPITQKLLDDSGFDLGGWIEGKITDKFGRSEGTAFITGNGVARPRGLLSYDTATTADSSRAWNTLQHVISGGATSITADALKNLVWALRAPYRTGATFLLNSNTANAIDKLKDSNGAYIWRDSMTAGAPPSLLGYPVEFDESMPDIAAGSLSIAFGNFKLAYVIVDRAGIRFLRDPFSDKPNVLFYAYKRVGGGIANSEAVKLLYTAAA